jgi:hypothetical protein
VGEEENQNQAGIVEVREGVKAGAYKGTGEYRDGRIVGGRNLERTVKAGGVADEGGKVWTMVGRKCLQDAVQWRNHTFLSGTNELGAWAAASEPDNAPRHKNTSLGIHKAHS